MIPTAGGRRLPVAALSVALIVGSTLAGVAPAQAAPGAPASASASAAAVSLPAPRTRFEEYGVDRAPSVTGVVQVDLAGVDPTGLRYEYQLDGTGPWRTDGTGAVTGGEDTIVVLASAGDHLISVRVASTVGGVAVVGAATAPERVRSSGASLPYTPEVIVDGPRVTFRWDVRAALNGSLPEESSILYQLYGDVEGVDVDAVGSLTVDAGYDASVPFRLIYGLIPDTWAFAEAIGTTGSAPGSVPLVSAPPPAIVGQATSGTTLTVRTGLWQPAPVRLSYQWFRDGVPVFGETGPTYLVGANDTGSRLTVAVRGAREGSTSVTRTSAPTPRVPLNVIVAGIPSITGIATVGRTLTARPGSWRPSPVTFAYQWRRDGRIIPGAAASTYLLTEADRGHLITVRVSGSKPGYVGGDPRSSAARRIA